MRIVLIGGTGRSGTNITKNILSQNTDVYALPFEHRLTIDPDGIVDFYNSFVSWSPFCADRKIKRLEKFLLGLSEAQPHDGVAEKLCRKVQDGMLVSPRKYSCWELSRWFPGYEDSVHRLISELKKFEYPGIWPGTASYSVRSRIYFSDICSKRDLALVLGRFLDSLVTSALRKNKRKIFVEDNTWNILFSKELFDLMQDSCLIHVVRDPRDVVASLKKQRWAPSDTRQTIMFYKAIRSRWETVRKSLPRHRFMEFRLEDMVDNQAHIIRQLCAFTGIRYSKKMLVFSRRKSHIGRWKAEFSQPEKTLLDRELGKIIKSLGYK